MTSPDTSQRTARSVTNGLWCAVVVLVLIGVSAALLRALFPSDLGARGEPFRQQLLDVLGRHDRFVARRARDVAVFDSRFGTLQLATLLHVIPGGIFLLLAPFQFSSRIRNRLPGVHRWTGRVLLLAAVASASAAFRFGLFMPYAGLGEAVAIAVFGGLFLSALGIAFAAIRKRQVARHREWMIRAFAVAIAISVVRIIGALLDVALSPAGVAPQAVFVFSIWLGWIITVGAAELWIINTRRAIGVAFRQNFVTATYHRRYSGIRRVAADPDSAHRV